MFNQVSDSVSISILFDFIKLVNSRKWVLFFNDRMFKWTIFKHGRLSGTGFLFEEVKGILSKLHGFLEALVLLGRLLSIVDRTGMSNVLGTGKFDT